MQSKTYDIITVGGGLGGSALAKAMAEHGARVLVVERERHFKDRVRGEAMHPWGVAEARALGIYKLLHEACGHEIPWRDTYLGSERLFHRDLSTTTPQRAAEFAFYHPTMQEVLLTAAAEAGAEIRRGARVRGVKPGPVPTVEIEHDGQVEEVRTRLVVGADGRASLVRKWAGFAARRDPNGSSWRECSSTTCASRKIPPTLSITRALGQGVPLFPRGEAGCACTLCTRGTQGIACRGHASPPACSRVCENRRARRVFRRSQSARAARHLQRRRYLGRTSVPAGRGAHRRCCRRQ